MRIKEIQSLIKFVAKSGASEVSLEMKDVKITIKTSTDKTPVLIQNPVSQTQQLSDINVVSQPIQAQPEKSPESEAPAIADEELNLITVKSPIIGTFYRKPAPDKAPYVEVGDHIEKGQVVCIVEAMKMMNEIKSDFSGTIKSINVEDGTPVEFDQNLITVS